MKVLLDGKVLQLKDASFSTCKFHNSGIRSKKRLWEVSAESIQVNRKQQIVDVRNAKLKVFDIPLLYIPCGYFPMPMRKRKSGILLPKFSFSNSLGTQITVPLYFNIAPEKDFLLNARYMSKGGVLWTGEYRHLFQKGKLKLNFSLGDVRNFDQNGERVIGEKMNGHIKLKGVSKLSGGYFDFDIYNAITNGTEYMRTYGFTDDDVLVSNLKYFRELGEGYINIGVSGFRDLTLNQIENHKIYMVPEISLLQYCGEIVFKMNGIYVKKRKLDDYSRLSLSVSHDKEYDLGIFKCDSEVAFGMDFLSIKNKTLVEIHPELLLGVELPFVYKNPILKLKLRSELFATLKEEDIEVNEDSHGLEFSSLNLFGRERYYGLDRRGGGTKLNYGLVMSANPINSTLTMCLGQSIYLDDEYTRNNQDSGIANRYSDYVASVSLKKEGYNLKLQSRFDTKGELNRLYIKGHKECDKYFINFGSNFINKTNSDLEQVFKQDIFMDSLYKINDSWELGAKMTRRFNKRLHIKVKNDTIGRVFLRYQTDCLRVSFGVEKKDRGGNHVDKHYFFKIGIPRLG